MKTSLYVLLLLLTGCDSQADIEYNARKVQGLCEVFGAHPSKISNFGNSLSVICSNGLRLEVSLRYAESQDTQSGSKDSCTNTKIFTP